MYIEVFNNINCKVLVIDLLEFSFEGVLVYVVSYFYMGVNVLDVV